MKPHSVFITNARAFDARGHVSVALLAFAAVVVIAVILVAPAALREAMRFAAELPAFLAGGVAR